MAKLDFVYNTNSIPERENNFELIPPGMYQAMISKTELKTTSAGGKMLVNTWDILGPTHAGRKIWQNINIRHLTNPDTEAYGAQELGEVLRAIGLLGRDMEDSDELVGGNAEIKIIIKPAKGDWPEKNEMKGCRAIEGSQPPFAPSTPAPTPARTVPMWGKQ